MKNLFRLIILVVLLLLVYYVMPIRYYVYYAKAGVDLTDVGLTIYLALIPIAIAVLSLIYVLLTGRLKEAVLAVMICECLSFIMPMMGGLGTLTFGIIMGLSH